MDTLYLTPGNWDLAVDVNGNIAKAANPYSLAQDAASQIRTFAGEVWYDTTQGIPYPDQVLGLAPNPALMKSYFTTAALSVPEVTAAKVFLAGLTARALTGQVQITGTTGAVVAAGF